MIHAIKTSAFIGLLILASCSTEGDPVPQVPCEQLATEINAAHKAVLNHQAKGNGGNQKAWETELQRLINERDTKKNEFSKRHC